MAHVRFARQLQNLLPLPATCEVAAGSVAELIDALQRQFPGVATYLLHENGALRTHVNIFIGDQFLSDRLTLTDRLEPESEVTIMPALSGG